MTESGRYSIRGFIDRVKDKSYPEIMIAAQQEVAEVERLTAGGRRGAPAARAAGAAQYAADLKGLLFFLGHGIRPQGVSEDVFRSFRVICERLVAKGQFLPTVLDVFNE